MIGKKIILYIFVAFIAGTLLLIYIQYNFAKNISSLINGNKKFLDEYQVNSELKELERDVVTIENNVRGAVTTNDTSHVRMLETEIAALQNDLLSLQKISDDDSTVKEVDELDSLVQVKMKFSKEVLNAFYLTGKSTAEKLIATERGKRLDDSILLLTQNIENTRRAILTRIITSTDKSGEKAKQFNTILIVLVLICSAGLFWYIINTIRKQSFLIQQLNNSENQVREAAQVKEKFMANMSHEIRTPMNAILGFTNLLQRKSLDEESKEYIQTIQKSGENLLTIINDVLDLSKIEAGMMRIESAPFSIRGLIHSIEIMFTARAVEKQLQISAEVDESVPDTLEGDATRLTQILVNLIGNALKFTSKGSILIKIANEGIADNLVKIGITVRDTGIGIEKEKLQYIFDRFQQAEDSVTRKYGGTGLGLSIVNDLVLLQKGIITVESVPGTGTTFTLIIPYKISTEHFNDKLSTDTYLNILSNFEDTFILVVEDNVINQSLIKHLFKSWQLDYNLVSNGREAIDKLQINKYDLILMDLQMPEMDGYTATQEIRNKLKLNTPIIAMTAHAYAGEREKCLSYGMNEYISKPIREEKLHKLITQFTQKKNFPAVQGKSVIKTTTGAYQYINLQYMKEVSAGNIEYEKTVTEQFIEAIPHDLLALETAWQQNDINQVRQLAHNMKTTVSVMGLNEVLQPYLDTIEYENLNEESFSKIFLSVKSICNPSVEEAKQFYTTL